MGAKIITNLILLVLLTFGLYGSYAQIYTELTGTGLPDLSLGTVAAADLDNDGYTDIVISGLDGSNLFTGVYFNNADGTFTASTTPPTAVYNSNIAIGDYNNDGLKDILITGENFDPVSALWKNMGQRTFQEVNAGLTNIGASDGNAEMRDIDNDNDLDLLLGGFKRNQDGSYSAVMEVFENLGGDQFQFFNGIVQTVFFRTGSFGDYDNDGDLDLLTGGANLQLHLNLGDGLFDAPITPPISFPAGKMHWFDYNQDGRKDVFVSHQAGAGEFITEVLINTGNLDLPFEALDGTMFDAPQRRNMDIRDYNADGKLDIILMGTLDFTLNLYTTKVYEGDGTGFTENTSLSLPQIGNGDVVWFDLENDGDLDILVTGEEKMGPVSKTTKLLRNDSGTNTYTPNTAPTFPANFLSTTSGDSVTFSWDTGVDVESPDNTLTYHIMVLQDAGVKSFIEADTATGWRRSQAPGNAGNNISYNMFGFPKGINQARIQSIDGALEGSVFSESIEFIFGVPEAPYDLMAGYLVSNNTVELQWMDSSIVETSFVIEQSKESGQFMEIGTTGANETSFVISDPEPGVYDYRIYAKNVNGSSDFAIYQELGVGVPAIPGNFTAVENNGDVILTWVDVTSETRYILEWSATGETSNYELLEILDRDIVTYTHVEPQNGSNFYRIQAANNATESDFTTTDIVITGIFGEEYLEGLVQVYPNPVQAGNLLRFNLEMGSPIVYRIINSQGYLLKEGRISSPRTSNNHYIDLTTLKGGIYVILLERNDEKYAVRFVKE